MNEGLFQLIWAHSLYRTGGLVTTSGEEVTVIFSGRLNRNAGPDFLEARIKIGGTTWVGNVEMHLKTGDWLKHGHDNDPAYRNIILHVVYEHDGTQLSGNGPTLELKPHIDQAVLQRAAALLQNPGRLPCSGLHLNVKYLVKANLMSRLLAERWEQKLESWNIFLEHSAEDWRNLLYHRMAANFGFKVNEAPFLMLAQSLPLNVVSKHRDNPLQIEALLFGQAGMLKRTWEDRYPNDLQKEYGYLQKKYHLTPLPEHLWKFLRMRPANFPTIRIAQFAALLQQSVHLFSSVIEKQVVKDIYPLLDVSAGSYWDTHFTFDEPQKKSVPKNLGRTSVENIIINTIAPIKFLYASRQEHENNVEQVLQLLETVPPEKNNITAVFEADGWPAYHAAQSQALIQLYNAYCSPKRCLECSVGLSILKGSR